ncbi:MAG: DUF3786 domain-containing protein [Planctomycetota bacterium]|nr:DUF3786 domain-containing protein [Planctomycetota bacterium]
MADKPGPMDVLWQRLQAESPEAVARRAAVQYDAAGQAYVVPLCGQPMRILSAAKRVEGPGGPAGFFEPMLAVQYLLMAQDEPPAGEWVNPRAIPSGDFFFRRPHDFPTERLEEAFGDRPEAFCKAAEKIGGRPVAAGDAAYEFAALPRVPMTVILWQTDEEFPARVQMLVDRAAHRQLPLDALWVLSNVLAKRLIAAAEK